jgi:hypothetical protein
MGLCLKDDPVIYATLRAEPGLILLENKRLLGLFSIKNYFGSVLSRCDSTILRRRI